MLSNTEYFTNIYCIHIYILGEKNFMFFFHFNLVYKQLLLPLWKNKRGQRRRKAWAGGGREIGGNRGGRN